MKDRKASIDFRSRGEVLITSDGETHVFHCELPARKPLTDEEIENCLSMGIAAYTTVCGKAEIIKFARAIEKAHGIGEQ